MNSEFGFLFHLSKKLKRILNKGSFTELEYQDLYEEILFAAQLLNILDDRKDDDIQSLIEIVDEDIASINKMFYHSIKAT